MQKSLLYVVMDGTTKAFNLALSCQTGSNWQIRVNMLDN